MNTENGDKPMFPDPMRGADQSYVNQSPWELNPGITKREYFAAMALQGLIASDKQASANINTAAEYAIKFADELLKQLGE